MNVVAKMARGIIWYHRLKEITQTGEAGTRSANYTVFFPLIKCCDL